jgi:auxin efflux carrier family protein
MQEFKHNGGLAPSLPSSQLPSPHRAKDSQDGPRNYKALKALVALVDVTLFNPPTLAALLAVAVALAPPVKQAIFTKPGNEEGMPPLDVVAQVLTQFGNAMIPALMLSLGGALSKGPGSDVPVRVILGVIVVRLLLVPVLGALVVVGLRHWGAFKPPDKMFMFVALLQHATPSASNVYTLAAVHDNNADSVATILFWQYLASIPTTPVCVGVYLALL